MPRVKELCTHNKKKTILQFCLDWKGWNDKRLEKELGISHSTRSARFKDVDTFSLGELIKIIHGVPLTQNLVSELLGGVNWDLSSMEVRLYEVKK